MSYDITVPTDDVTSKNKLTHFEHSVSKAHYHEMA